jgi:hypothetical protein
MIRNGKQRKFRLTDLYTSRNTPNLRFNAPPPACYNTQEIGSNLRFTGSMSFARQLFWLWLISSVLWIGTVGAIRWPWGWQWPNPWEEIRLAHGNLSEVRTPDGAIHQFPADVTADEIDRAVTNYWRWHEAKSTLRLALIVPVLVLLIGAAFGWASNGFRPTDPG